jgi:hypothetical protein
MMNYLFSHGEDLLLKKPSSFLDGFENPNSPHLTFGYLLKSKLLA